MLIINPQYQLQIVVLFFEKHINFKYRSQIPQQFQMRQQEEKKKKQFQMHRSITYVVRHPVD